MTNDWNMFFRWNLVGSEKSEFLPFASVAFKLFSLLLGCRSCLLLLGKAL